MQLSDLLQNVCELPADADRTVSGLTLDSRRVAKGDVFLAVTGTHQHGQQFLADAIKNGAAAVLIEAAHVKAADWQSGVPIIGVFQLREKLPLLASRFYHQPADKLKLIGVTGTNGKTSCSHFIAEILSSHHIPCGIIGTLGYGFYGQLVETGLTTPDVVTIQKTLHDFVAKGAEAVTIEVSSHSIDQGRIAGLDFETAIFTNLTQDHLDYHGTMEVYAAVKYHFLDEYPIKHLVINVDDPYGVAWATALLKTRSVFTYSTQPVRTIYPNHIDCESVSLNVSGMRAIVNSPFGRGELLLPLIGSFNLSNALAALTTLCLYGIPFEKVIEAFRKIHPVPGRMQSIVGEGKPLVVVDYAHTPDALQKTLTALRSHTKGRLICVFGCGGDRDAVKRPLMAEIVEKTADQVIVTNDNPRREDPDKILNDIMQGFGHPDKIIVELDRAKAIQKSIQSASENDCVLIAGKGAEQYQQIGDQKRPFDDLTCAKQWLNQHQALEK